MKKHTPLELDIRQLLESQGVFVADSLIQSILNKIFLHCKKVMTQKELETLLIITQHSGNRIQRNLVRVKTFRGKNRVKRKRAK